MHITEVSGTNLKGGNFSYKLAPCTVVAGPNMVGKTRISDAVRLALLGKLPELGGKPGDAFALSSADRMGVSLEIDMHDGRGHHIERTLQQMGESVKCTPAKIDAQYACALLDAEAWFSATERERIDFVFRNVAMPPDKSPAGVIAALQRISFDAEHSEAIEEAKREVILNVAESMENMGADTDLSKLPDAILAADADLAEDFTLWNGRANEAQGAVRTLTELKLREDECSAATLTDLRNDVERLQGLADEAQRTHARLQEQQRAAKATAARRQQINDALLDPAPEAKGFPAFSSSVDLEKAQQAHAHATQRLAELPEEDAVTAGTASYDARMVKEKAMAELNQAEDGIIELEDQLRELGSHSECPYCKGNSEGWDARVRATIEAALIARRAAKEAKQSAFDAAKNAFDALSAEFKRMESRQQGRRQVLGELDQINSQILRHQRDTEEHARTVESITKGNAAREDAHKLRQVDLRAELDRLEEAAGPSERELNDAAGDTAAASAELKTTQEKVRVAEALANDMKRAAQASEIGVKAAARRDVIKAMRSKLVEIKGELVASAFGALLEVANRIAGDILPSPLHYDEASNQVGRWSPTGFIPWKVLSGTEKALCFVAVAAALSSKAPMKLLILDELARLTPRLQQRVIETLGYCVHEGILDQVIVIIPSDSRLPDRVGWTTIYVEASK